MSNDDYMILLNLLKNTQLFLIYFFRDYEWTKIRFYAQLTDGQRTFWR